MLICRWLMYPLRSVVIAFSCCDGILREGRRIEVKV